MANCRSARPVSFTELAFGAALFSEGYSIGLIGTVVTFLTRQYPASQFGMQYYSKALASVTFAGVIFAMFVLGLTAARPTRMSFATSLSLSYSVLTGLWANVWDDVFVLVRWLCVLRFMLGIGIGAGQPCVLAYVTEHAEHIKDVPEDEHCRWLALATNTMVNMGYVIAAFVVLVLTWFIDEDHIRAVWALSSGPGCIYAFLWCPFTPRHYPLGRVPHWQTFKRYWKCLLGLSLSWFIYDFISYPLVIYSSVIMNNITGGNSPLWIVFGWSFFIHLLPILGTVLGAFFIDHRGPKTTMIIGLLLQAAVGFGMVTVCKPLTNHIAGFAVFYGIFLSLGEVGPGNCLSVLTARTIPTAIREQFYGIAAGIGKVGALVGTWVFPQMIDAFGDSKTAKGSTGPFWSGSGLAILSAVILFFLVEPLSRDGIKAENEALLQYLKENAPDVRLASIRDDVSTCIEYDQNESWQRQAEEDYATAQLHDNSRDSTGEMPPRGGICPSCNKEL